MKHHISEQSRVGIHISMFFWYTY